MKTVKIVLSSAAFALALTVGAQAQVTVDMSRFTCEQLLRGTENSIEAAVWISGYYNGMHKNTKLNLEQFKKNAEAVVAECGANPGKTVMATINTMLSAGKKRK